MNREVSSQAVKDEKDRHSETSSNSLCPWGCYKVKTHLWLYWNIMACKLGVQTIYRYLSELGRMKSYTLNSFN